MCPNNQINPNPTEAVLFNETAFCIFNCGFKATVKKVADFFYWCLSLFEKVLCLRWKQAFWDIKHFYALQAFAWKCTTYPYQLKQTHYDQFSQETKNSIRTYAQITNQQALLKSFNLFLQKGSCYGLCLYLIELIQKNPDTSIDQLIPLLKQNHQRILELQVIEIIRPILQKNHSPFNPPIKPNNSQTFPLKQLFQFGTDLSNFLAQQDSGTFHFRTYNLKTAEAHSTLFLVDNTNSNYGFFNPQTLAYYQFSDLQTGLTSFIAHMEAYTEFYTQSDDLYWAIEVFKP